MVTVPATPMTAPASAGSTGHRSRASSMSATAASTWSPEGGSWARWRSLRRTDPMSRDCATSTVPSARPRMSSVDPPPMSQTRIGSDSGGNARVAPRKLSRASSSPSSTSGSTPTRSRTPVRNSSEFSASRAAEVAQNLVRATSWRPTTSMYSSSAENTRCSEVSASRPVRSTPCPSRTMRISRTRSLPVPEPASRSATSSRREFVPQSKAATRVIGRPCRRGRRGRRGRRAGPRTVRTPTTRRGRRAPRRPAG